MYTPHSTIFCYHLIVSMPDPAIGNVGLAYI